MLSVPIGLLLNQLCGANLVHDVGYLDGGKTGSLPFLVLCDDFIDAARHIGAGTKIDPDRLATEEITAHGPAGHYLGSEHTLKYFREEIWMPTVFNRMMYETWEQLGRKDCITLAREKALELLSGEYSPGLSRETVERIEALIKKTA